MLAISKDEYADLLKSAEAYEMLKRVIYESAEISFLDKCRLVLKTEKKDDVMDALKVLDNRRYREVLDGLYNNKPI